VQVRTLRQDFLRETARLPQFPNARAHVLANVARHRGNGARLDKIGLHTIVCMTMTRLHELSRDRHDVLPGILTGTLVFVWVLACGGGGMVDVTADVNFLTGSSE
jgi:hypothetical protein